MTLHNLEDMQILAVDCQTTGGPWRRSHLIEIGWMPLRAADRDRLDSTGLTTRLVQQPQGIDLPKKIQRLTGLQRQDFNNAIEAHDAWQELCKQAAAVAASNQMPVCPAVIHFARFEMTFLGKLQTEAFAGEPFPLEVFCSHKMSARIWPRLPRKGLRAVAGYLGCSIPPLKRCGSHLRATATIWCSLVEKLRNTHGVSTIDDLRTWIQKDDGTPPQIRSYPMPRRIRLSVPDLPGIYGFRRPNNDLLYIGKAASLKRRINSYFQSGRRHSETILEMLTQAVKLEVTTTSTALEAALLESDEIKRRQPPYNTALTGVHRELHFFSKDFKHHAPRVNDQCPLGPVASADVFTALHAIGQTLHSNCRDRKLADAGQMLGLADAYAPDQDCLRHGLELFANEFAEMLKRGDPWRALIRIGHKSWQEKLARREHAADSEKASENVEPETERSEPFVWTPAAVSKTIASISRRCGFLLRRSRWLIMLSEAAIAWSPHQTETPQACHVLVLQGGDIGRRLGVETTDALPPPPGGHLPPGVRQANLDLTTYDRLRVLTTELRRLVSDGRSVTIRLNRRATINSPQLNRLFRWI